MQVLDILRVTDNYNFKWPGGDIEKFDSAITYKAFSNAGNHEMTIGYSCRNTYGNNRRRVVVWIDNYPYAEFLAADDFNITGEVLSEIRFSDDKGESKRMCRYASDAIPQRYSMFRVDSLKRRVTGERVHEAWVIVVNISDHITMLALAGMRKYETE